MDTIKDYFNDFSNENCDFSKLLEALEQYFILIVSIGDFLEKPASPSLI